MTVCRGVLICRLRFSKARGNAPMHFAASPATLQFTIMLALLCIVLVLPVDLMVGYLVDEVGAGRPQFKRWGWNMNGWFGTANLPFAHDDDSVLCESSPLVTRCCRFSRCWKRQEKFLWKQFPAIPVLPFSEGRGACNHNHRKGVFQYQFSAGGLPQILIEQQRRLSSSSTGL